MSINPLIALSGQSMNTAPAVNNLANTIQMRKQNDRQEKNGSLMKEIFSQEEIGLLKRFALQVKRTQLDLVKSRENPSGTAQVAGKALADVVKRVSNVFALSGEPTLAVTSNGVSTLKGLSSTSKAKNAMRPEIVGSSTGMAKQAIQE